MKIISTIFISLLFLFSLMIYDNVTYDTKEKYANIQKIASSIKYSTISTQFKSKDYQEFVYAK